MAKQPVRRLVTGHDGDGAGTVLFDGPAPNARHRKSGVVSTMLWHNATTPAAFSDGEDWSLGDFPVAPPPGGAIFRVVDFPPEAEAPDIENAAMLAEMGLDPDQNADREGVHHSMHTTRSVDFAVVMSGEIDMILDSGEVHLEAGDTFVQQGTAHGYINRGSEPCRIAFVLIDAKEAD
jgi:mannose-6-phosphate isomerase-like protein (cupin superfamily)